MHIYVSDSLLIRTDATLERVKTILQRLKLDKAMSAVSNIVPNANRPSARASRLHDTGHGRMKLGVGSVPLSSPPYQPPPRPHYKSGNNGAQLDICPNTAYVPIAGNTAPHYVVTSPIPSATPPPASYQQGLTTLERPHPHFTCRSDDSIVPPGFIPRPHRWVPPHLRPFSDEYFNTNTLNEFDPKEVEQFPCGLSAQRSAYDVCYKPPSQVKTARKLTGNSHSPSPPVDTSNSLSRSVETNRQKAPYRRGSSQAFHSLYLKQISPPGTNRTGNLQSSQLHLEFLSHLQGIMQEIVPGSRFRLHGGVTANIQVSCVCR